MWDISITKRYNIDGKNLEDGLGNSVLWKWPYYFKPSVDLMKSLSKFQWHSLRNPEIELETKALSSQSNPEQKLILEVPLYSPTYTTSEPQEQKQCDYSCI